MLIGDNITTELFTLAIGKPNNRAEPCQPGPPFRVEKTSYAITFCRTQSQRPEPLLIDDIEFVPERIGGRPFAERSGPGRGSIKGLAT